MMNSHRPVLAEPDQRYWRARANRRVRKARYTRILLRWSLIVLINGAFLTALVLMAQRGADRVKDSGKFALESIELVGVQRASAESIRAGLAPAIGRGLLDLDLARVDRSVRRDPWILDASVRRVLPRTLRISVTEREPAALAVIRGVAHVVDRTGYVIGPVGTGPAEDLPVLTGLEEISDEELVQALRFGVAMIDRLRVAAGSFAGEVSELDLSRDDRVTVVTVERGPRILLDPRRVERNVQRFMALRNEIERRMGPIEYVDLRWRDRITVKPVMTPDNERS